MHRRAESKLPELRLGNGKWSERKKNPFRVDGGFDVKFFVCYSLINLSSRRSAQSGIKSGVVETLRVNIESTRRFDSGNPGLNYSTPKSTCLSGGIKIETSVSAFPSSAFSPKLPRFKSSATPKHYHTRRVDVVPDCQVRRFLMVPSEV